MNIIALESGCGKWVVSPRLTGVRQALATQSGKHQAVTRIASCARRHLDCQGAFREIAQNCVQALRRDYEAAVGGTPNAIHNMRIALTRLNAAAHFFSPAVDDARWVRINNQINGLNSVLGKARDHDVTMEYARKKRYRDWAVSSLPILLRSQQEAHRQLARKLASARYRRLITELDQWIVSDYRRHTGQLLGSARADIFSQGRLLSWRNKICRKGKHLQTMRSKQLHRFRIRCKHYRYIVDSLRSLGIPLSDRDLAFCKIVKRAHRDLGDIRDLRRFCKVTHVRPLGYRRQKRKLVRMIEDSFARAA